MTLHWEASWGPFYITTLECGNFRLDGGAMFGVVPRVLWEKFHPPDDQNRIEMALRLLLIRWENRIILVDTGLGSERTEKFRQIYAFEGDDDYLLKALLKIGIKPEEVTDVILTHLHFDHCGGSTHRKNTDPSPFFPNARYYIQERQLHHARSRNDRDKASYFSEDFEPLIQNRQAEIYSGPFSLISGVDVLVFQGHTPGMQCLKLHYDGKTLFYAADLIPLHSHCSLPWIMAYDLYPLTTLEEKRALLTQAYEDKWFLIFEHDPFYSVGKVELLAKGFAFQPIG
ncbi:MAG: MBL fold metallo-hydrolase [bacterium]